MRTTNIGPNRTARIKVIASNKYSNQSFSCVIHANPDLFNKTKIFIKERNVYFNKGEATIPVVNCKSKTVTLKSGSIIGTYTPLSEAVSDSLNTELNSSEGSSDNDSSEEDDSGLIWFPAKARDPFGEASDGQTMFQSRKRALKESNKDLLHFD
jgi:hypothetical protein